MGKWEVSTSEVHGFYLELSLSVHLQSNLDCLNKVIHWDIDIYTELEDFS